MRFSLTELSVVDRRVIDQAIGRMGRPLSDLQEAVRAEIRE
jgi:hypothetical protein